MSNPITEEFQDRVLGGLTVLFKHISDLNQNVYHIPLFLWLAIQQRPQFLSDCTPRHALLRWCEVVGVGRVARAGSRALKIGCCALCITRIEMGRGSQRTVW